MPQESLIRIVAHLMGDGQINHTYLRYNNHCKYLLDQFKNDMTACFDKLHFTEGKVNSGTSFIQVQKRVIVRGLYSLAPSYKSGDIEVPKFVDTLEKKIVFTRSLFDDEGSVGLRVFSKTGEIKRDVHIVSKSKKMIEWMTLFLNNELNITTNRMREDKRIRNGKIFSTWVLTISGKYNLQKFKEKINFYHPDKVKKIEELLRSYIRK